ncbi:MAG: hypothetical protein KAR20_27425, partial [Candidatus Heimdallarchaeota archaeon]|nr:hypothetical protein [Candidatus Heimdallarchaeota archaeon]
MKNKNNNNLLIGESIMINNISFKKNEFLTLTLSLIVVLSMVLIPLSSQAGEPIIDPSQINILCDNNNNQEALNYRPGELIIKMTDTALIHSMTNSYDAETIQGIPELGIFLINTNQKDNMVELATEISSQDDVIICHPNYLIDPLDPVQGSLPIADINGLGDYDRQISALRLNLEESHNLT